MSERMGINSPQMRSVVVLILCTYFWIYFWIYLRPPRCSNSTPFGGPVSLLGGQAPPGVRVILTLVYYVAGPPLLNGRCTSLLRAPVSEMTYTVSSGTLNSTIPYHTGWIPSLSPNEQCQSTGGSSFPVCLTSIFIMSLFVCSSCSFHNPLTGKSKREEILCDYRVHQKPFLF